MQAGMPCQPLPIFLTPLLISSMRLFPDQGFAKKFRRRDGKPHHCDITAYGFLCQVPQVGHSALANSWSEHNFVHVGHLNDARKDGTRLSAECLR